MSRLLRNKAKAAFYGLIVLAIVSACLLHLYAVALLIVAAVWLNKKVVMRIERPMEHLGARRRVETVDTLVIGDTCSEKVLSRYCDLKSCLTITAPSRSLAASAQILAHVESVLKEGGKVIIVKAKHETSQAITIFDLPMMSLIAALESGYQRRSFLNRRIPFFRYPLRSIRMLMRSRADRQEIDCPDKDIAALCQRKGFNLVCLA